MAATYREAAEVEQLAREVIQSAVDHDHLRGARVKYLFRDGTWNSKGKPVLGKAQKVAGLQKHFAEADFLVIVNEEAWREMDLPQRKALVDHQLCCCGQDERGNWILNSPDVEEFSSVIARHGLWMQEIEAFAHVAKDAIRQVSLFDGAEETEASVDDDDLAEEEAYAS